MVSGASATLEASYKEGQNHISYYIMDYKTQIDVPALLWCREGRENSGGD